MTEVARGGARKRLRIYLNDHLMGATAGRELARRCAQSNTGTRFEAPLRQLLTEIVEDRSSLLELLRVLEVPANRFKVTVAVVGERLGRLKANGQLRGYSPLSRLVELEGLHAGVNAKISLWLTLRHVGFDVDGGSAEVDLDRLVARAQSQLDRLEEMRIDAATSALSGAAGGREPASRWSRGAGAAATGA